MLFVKKNVCLEKSLAMLWANFHTIRLRGGNLEQKYIIARPHLATALDSDHFGYDINENESL